MTERRYGGMAVVGATGCTTIHALRHVGICSNIYLLGLDQFEDLLATNKVARLVDQGVALRARRAERGGRAKRASRYGKREVASTAREVNGEANVSESSQGQAHSHVLSDQISWRVARGTYGSSKTRAQCVYAIFVPTRASPRRAAPACCRTWSSSRSKAACA